MYLQYQLMKTLQDERLRAAARDHLAAEARRARTAGRDHAAATRAGATARGAATMARKRGAIIGLGIPLGAILLFPQGIIPAVLKLAHARGRIWFLPLYLPKPLQWPACFVMIILGVAVYCYVLWTMRRLKKSSRELHAGKGGGRSPKSALTRIGTGQNLGAAPRDASAVHAQNVQISISGSAALRSTLAAQAHLARPPLGSQLRSVARLAVSGRFRCRPAVRPSSPQHVVTWPGGVVCRAPGSGPGGLPGRRPLSRRRS
jgi:hypothetical protein